MLASRAPRAFVCFRCEAQTARRRLPVVPRANFSASARLCEDASDNKDALSELDRQEIKITRVVQPLNRVKRRKGKIIKETSASLGGIKQLGDNADILVLREIEVANREDPAQEPEIIEPARPIEVPDIFASLQQEGKAVTPEEVYQQIGSLRPKNDGDPGEPHYIKQTTFVKLKNMLMNGFTQHQLMTFYSVAKNIKRGQVNKGVIDSLRREEDNPKRPVERSEWQPGTTSITKRLPGVDRHVKTLGWRKNVSKQLLVDRILRDQWNLLLLEEIEAPGELELFLKPWQMALLTVGEHNVLNEIRLMRKVKLQIYEAHDIVRITADKSTAEYAANDIEEALQHTETKRMNLKKYIPLLEDVVIPEDQKLDLTTFYSQKDLEVVSALTKTSIAATSKNLFTIKGFNNAAVEEAKRSLINFLPLRDGITHTLDTLDLGSEGTSVYPAPVYVEKSSLEYQFRNAALARLLTPHPRIAAPESANDAQESAVASTSSKAALQGLIDRTTASLIQDFQEFPQVEDPGNWELEPQHKLVAKFGQALVPLDRAGTEEADSNTSGQLSQSTFFSTLPGLSSFLASPDLSVSTRLNPPVLNYHFQPDPEQTGFDASQLFPTLIIRMKTDRQGAKAYFRKASIRFWQHVHTVSLPNKAVDLQFYKYGGLRLQRDHNDANVQKWISAAAKSIESGERIVAPPLTIDIPKWTIPGFSSDEKGMATVKYYFSGVDFRQTVSGTMLGEKISYSTIQSGKLNAKGGELIAYFTGHGNESFRDEAALRSYVKKCHDIVDLITNASAQTSPLSRQVRPRDAGSARKAKRSEMANGVSEAVDEVSGETSEDLQEHVADGPNAQEYELIGEPSITDAEVREDESSAAADQYGNDASMPPQPWTGPEDEEDSADSSAKNA